MIDVLIADDHPLVLQGLRAVFAASNDITVVAEASDGHDAVRLAAEYQPGVAVVDVGMPGLDGLEVTRQILERCTTAVVVLTMYDDDETVIAAIQAGAAGYLLKGADGNDILTAVRSAAAGHAVFAAALLDRLPNWLGTVASVNEPGPFPGLTAREREILDNLADGLPNAAIGKRLGLSTKTIANNISAILNKLHCTQRGEAIILARNAGLGHHDITP